MSRYVVACCSSVQNLPYEGGTWPLTLKEKHRRRACENGVLRAIFGRKREEVTGRLRK
jgi:hypothetical protein